MPIPGSVHFIVNKATGTVVTLNLEDGKTVTGDPLNRQKNQMVRFTVTPRFPLRSGLISITMQWSLIKGEVYWAIQSVATNGYLSVEEHPPVNNDKVVVVEADIAPFTWELCPDGDEYQ